MFLDAATLVSSIRQFMEFQLRDAISANTLLCVPTWAQNQRRALYVPSEDMASPAAQPRTGRHAGASSVHSDGSGPAQANRESRVCPLMIIAGPPSAHWKVFGRSHALRLLLLLRLFRGVSHRPAARGDILPYAGHRVAPGQRDPGQHEYCSNHTCHLTIPKKWMA